MRYAGEQTDKTCDTEQDKEPKEKPSIVYKNDLVKKDLGIQFRPVKETLKNYSN